MPPRASLLVLGLAVVTAKAAVVRTSENAVLHPQRSGDVDFAKNASDAKLHAKLRHAATAAAKRDGMKTFVYVKLHHVGSRTAMVVTRILKEPGRKSHGNEGIEDLAEQLPNPILQSAKTFMADHPNSLPALDKWAKKGKVPTDTWATVLLREPVAKFLSKFFSNYFFAGEKYIDPEAKGQQGPGSLKEAKKSLPALNDYVTTRKWKGVWETDNLFRFFRDNHTRVDCEESSRFHYPKSPCEYSDHFGTDVKQARTLLNGFKVVGITEDEDCFLAQTCALLGEPPERCIEDKDLYEDVASDTAVHERPKHPTLADFSDEAQAWFKQRFAIEYEIYGIAKEIADRQKAQGFYGHRVAACAP